MDEPAGKKHWRRIPKWLGDMPWEEALQATFGFGKFRSRTLGQVLAEDDGSEDFTDYLCWLLTVVWPTSKVYWALRTYLRRILSDTAYFELLERRERKWTLRLLIDKEKHDRNKFLWRRAKAAKEAELDRRYAATEHPAWEKTVAALSPPAGYYDSQDEIYRYDGED